jgi:hypothetical protein
MKRLLLTLTATLMVLPSVAAAAPPERQASGNRLISQRDPAITITLPRSARYVGADRWDLYGICDAELHVFVEADAQKRVRALYWIQFEGYLPSNTHVYDYSKDEPLTFAGLPFWKRARFGPTSDPQRAGSDGEHVRQLLAREGYQLPPHMMNVRLVHLLDDSRRKELMFIYSEDLAPQGYTSEQLMDGGQPRPAWGDIEKGLVDRAMKRIGISR